MSRAGGGTSGEARPADVAVVINGSEHSDDVWGNYFHDLPGRLAKVEASTNGAPQIIRSISSKTGGGRRIVAVVLCINEAVPGGEDAYVQRIREALPYPLTPLLIMSRLIDPADEIRAFRELLAYDFFAYPPTTALLTKRLSDCARFYERTQNLRVFCGELFGNSRFSASCLHAHIWEAPRQVTVIGSADPWMRRVLESVPGCSMQFIRRADEVEATLQASRSPDGLVVAPNELESGGMTLAHWADLRGVPIIGLSDTYRLQSVIGCRLAGFDDVLVCSMNPDIVRERIRAHVAWGVLRRKADERAAGYSLPLSKCH